MAHRSIRLAAIAALVVSLVAACGPSVAPSASPSAAVASTSGVGPSASSVAAASPTAGTASASPTATAAPTASPPPTAAATATPVPTLVPTADPTDPPPVSEFPQTWTGSWEDPATGGTGALELVLTGKGGEFGGTITMDGTACLVTGTLEGSYDGRDIAFTVSQRGTILEFAGTAGDDGIDGTIRSECDALDGTWTAQRAE